VSIPRSLRRLHELRTAEEEQRKALLQSALGELNRLESVLRSIQSRAMRGRALVRESLRSGSVEARLSGVEEIVGAERLEEVLRARVRTAGAAVQRLSAEFLAKRVERRQTETLLDARVAQQEVEQQRKAQAALDEWFRSCIPAVKDGSAPSDRARSRRVVDEPEAK
jgi:flagellar export protein FliJ